MKLATSNRDASVSGACKLLVAVVNNVTGMTAPSKGVMAFTWGMRDGSLIAEAN